MDQRLSSPPSSRLSADRLEPDLADAEVQTEALHAEVGAELDRLRTLDLGGLRIRYRQLTRKTVAETVPKWLLLRLVAHRLQVGAFGDLDAATLKALDGVARALAAADRARECGKPRPVVPSVPGIPTRRFRTGTVLVREHAGTLHRVTVTEDGFAWNGGAYRSLSEVARAITGTVWNGPAFFGLKEKVERSRAVSANSPAVEGEPCTAAPRRRGRGSARQGEQGLSEGGAA